MDRLILFRHGKAEHVAPSGDDFDRELNARGVGDSAAMGRRLAAEGCAPDLALVSSAARAVQTYEAARVHFPAAAERRTRMLYLASGQQLLAAIDKAAVDASVLMVVAHNPGLHELAMDLAARGTASARAMGVLELRFPTAAAAVFAFDADGTPHLEAFHLPEGKR